LIRAGILASVKRGHMHSIPLASVEVARQRKTERGPAPTTGARQRRRERERARAAGARDA
jgi:hypothetical protein